MQYSSFLESVLKETTTIAREKFGRVSGSVKPGDTNQVLTDADIAIGNHLIRAIEKTYPDHNIIDEEAGVIDKKSRFTWVIDPIDGTSNFAQGIPLYGTMIGLLDEATPIAGGIAMPFFEDIYLAEKGSGAFCNGNKIQASAETELINTLIAYTIDGHREDPERSHTEGKILGELVLGIRNLRASGSCFDVVMVARGKYGGYVNQTSKIWDNVAPQILLEEAGCLYTDFMGSPISYTDPLTKAKNNYTFCSAPPELHKQLQVIIHQLT
jgi:myo-inositol-1(or 4)-monophosphatase